HRVRRRRVGRPQGGVGDGAEVPGRLLLGDRRRPDGGRDEPAPTGRAEEGGRERPRPGPGVRPEPRPKAPVRWVAGPPGRGWKADRLTSLDRMFTLNPGVPRRLS